MWPIFVSLGNLISSARTRDGGKVLLGFIHIPVLPDIAAAAQTRVNAAAFLAIQAFLFDRMLAWIGGFPFDVPGHGVQLLKPAFAFFIADRPEQVKIAGVKSNWAPRCPTKMPSSAADGEGCDSDNDSVDDYDELEAGGDHAPDEVPADSDSESDSGNCEDIEVNVQDITDAVYTPPDEVCLP